MVKTRRTKESIVTRLQPRSLGVTMDGKSKHPRRKWTGYTYSRGKNWVDDTWDIYDPDGKFIVCIRFWDEPNSTEAAETEARAKLIVETLNKGYWW